MADRLAADRDRPSLFALLVAGFIFLIRRIHLFAVICLPIAVLAGGISWILEIDRRLVYWRNDWVWDLLFTVVYALFLNRWIKESLLDGATDCEEVDNLRRAIVSPRFLLFAIFFYVFAIVLGTLPIEWIVAPAALSGTFFGDLLPWLPHLVFWSMILALFCLYLPALSVAEGVSLRLAVRLTRAARPQLIELILGAALLSLLGTAAASHWGLPLMPTKAWAIAAMAAAHRLFDCLLLAFVGHGLADLYRYITDWRQPEPEDRPYRGLGVKSRRIRTG